MKLKTILIKSDHISKNIFNLREIQTLIDLRDTLLLKLMSGEMRVGYSSLFEFLKTQKFLICIFSQDTRIAFPTSITPAMSDISLSIVTSMRIF